MQRTDLMDTSPEMHRMLIKLAREKGELWRIRKTFELCEEIKLLKQAKRVDELGDSEPSQ